MHKNLSRIITPLIYTLLIVSIAFVSSCKKNNDNPSNEGDPYAIDKSKTYLSDQYENKLKDSIWYYYKILSLWQDVILPTSNVEINKLEELGFIRNSYTQYFQTGDDVLEYLMSLTKNKNPNRKLEKDYDWYSFLVRGNTAGSNSLQNNSSPLGISVFFLQTANSGSNGDLYIRYVDAGSSAQKEGIGRGDQIISINNDANLDYDYQKAKNFTPLINYLNSNTINIKVRKPDGRLLEKTIVYKSLAYDNPILAHDVIQENGKKVGYLLFNSFDNLKQNGILTQFNIDLQSIFSRFEREGINDLVVDLRYNGGGDVETAEHLANRIAPSSETGKLMLTYKLNKMLTDMGWLNEQEDFAPVKFRKIGSLNLSKVYFLVSPNTASASELLINVLKPALPTFTIGTYSIDDKNMQIADKTYGKPVGFSEIAVVNDNVKLFPAYFKMYNRDKEGDYFSGMTPSTNVWEFSSFRDFADKKETMLAEALYHITTGRFSNTALKASTKITGSQKYSTIMPSPLQDKPEHNYNMYKFKVKLKNK